MSDDAQEWRWVGEDGVEKTVTEQELIAELSSESLPNYTLVWKKRWLEWLPAMQVAELGWALPPGKADSPVQPREKESAATPPAPPLYRYPVVKRRAANLKAGKPEPSVPKSAPKKAEPKAEPIAKKAEPKLEPTPAPAHQLSPVAPRAPTIKEREPEPRPPRAALDPPTQEWKPPDSSPNPIEEVDMDSIEASQPAASPAALHPLGEDALLEDEGELSDPLHPAEFGGVAPARSAFSPFSYGEEDDAETRVLPSRPPPSMGGAMYVAPRVPPSSERPPPDYDEAELDELPRFPPPPLPPADLSAYAASAGKAGQRMRLYAAGGVAAVVAVVGLFALMRGRSPKPAEAPLEASSDSPSPAVSDSAAPRSTEAARVDPAPAARHLGKPCTIATSATRVADWADPAVMPAFAAIPGSQRVAVGFAQSDTYAVGITIDPRTLDRDQVFREFRKPRLVSVVPTAGAGALHFQVVRDGFPLSNARVVDAQTPFFIGTTSEGIARITGKDSPVPIWSFPGADQSTVPRVTTVSGVGHAITFRRGGKSGENTAAWLEPSGDKKTELVGIKADGNFVGTPAIAANEDSIVIAFATRKSDGPSWTLELASAKHGELPTKATPFPLPPGGPGGDGISPAIAPLSGQRWLLTWTEGGTGTRVARAVVLDRSLSPITDALSLSPDGANAGQGVAWTSGDVGSVLFYVQNDKKSHELWGTSVDCPR